MKFSFLKHVSCLLIIGMMLASCSKDEQELKTNVLSSDAQQNSFVSESQKERIVDYLDGKGSCGDINFMETGAYYTDCDFTGCALHKRYSDLEDEINNSLKNSSEGSEKKARINRFNSYHHYPTDSNLKRGFKYLVDYSGCSSCIGIWQPYIERAFRYLEQTRRPYSRPNQTLFTSVHFRPAARNEVPDLTIKFFDFGTSEVFYGLAESPLNGKCGPTIWLQKNEDNLPSTSEMFHQVVVHEIMHTIGFAHSDYDLGTSIAVPGTGITDSRSIMGRAGIDNERDATIFLSAHDLKGIRKMYPQYLAKPTIVRKSKTFHSGSGRYNYSVTSKNRAIRRPYYWIEFQFYRGNVLVETKTIVDDAITQAAPRLGGGWQKTISFSSYNNYSRVTARGVNFKKDLRSAPSTTARF